MGTAPPPDPSAWLSSKLAELGSSVRFGRGVVGMSTRAMLGLMAIWGGVIWKVGPNLIQDAVAVGVGLVATVTFLAWNRSIQTFAERNPAQAMLDGGEFVEYERHRSEVKGSGPLSTPLIEGAATPELTQQPSEVPIVVLVESKAGGDPK